MIYFCCDEKRRKAVEAKSSLNGIDFLEVLDSEALPWNQRQRTLFVHFLKAAGLPALKPENIRIEGGERIRDVSAMTVTVDAAAPKVLVVTVNQSGDFSIYTLRLARSRTDPARLDGSIRSSRRWTFPSRSSARPTSTASRGRSARRKRCPRRRSTTWPKTTPASGA